MSMIESPSAPPSLGLLLLEMRVVSEFAAFLSFAPLWRLIPRGDGHPVLVLPGLAAGDVSTLPLRTFLKDRGYSPHGWELGMNRGARDCVEETMLLRLKTLAEQSGRKVSLIGWSLGGVFARELARATPEYVRCVISLGSGFGIQPTATTAGGLYDQLSGHKLEDWINSERMKRRKQPPPVPSTSIYSRSDGIVAWQGCLEQESAETENIEVECSHAGLGHHPAVLYAIADRLAQPEAEWRRFARTGLRSLIFQDPERDAA